MKIQIKDTTTLVHDSKGLTRSESIDITFDDKFTRSFDADRLSAITENIDKIALAHPGVWLREQDKAGQALEFMAENGKLYLTDGSYTKVESTPDAIRDLFTKLLT